MDKIKIFFINYFDKISMAAAIALLLYSVFFFYESTKINEDIKKMQEFAPSIENNLRAVKPDEPINLDYAINLKNSVKTITENDLALLLKQPNIIKIKHDPNVVRHTEFIPGETEIIFKGGTIDKALIVIKRNEENNMFEQSFITRLGEIIGGNEPAKGLKLTEFMTGCTLVEIVSNAKKTLTTTKKVVTVNENGEFAGTITKEEPYQINSMKIKYINDRLGGKIQELWLGETANLGTITALINLNSSNLNR